MSYEEMYRKFERKYNPVPVQMSRHEAFEYALADGEITQDVYNRAKLYFGSLWDYTGT